jgi:mycothiol synthase
MITHRLADRLDGQELEDVLQLVRDAWAYDEEAGFTRIPESLVRQASDDRLTVRHLMVRGKLDDLTWDGEGGDLLAYAHLVVDDGRGLIRVVVDPAHRSRGVLTLAVETIGLTIGAEGWLDSGAQTVRGWAYGHHPAAERFARRFGLIQLSRTWLQVRQLTGPHADDLPEAPLPPGVAVQDFVGQVDEVLLDDCTSVLADSGLSQQARQQVLNDLRAGGSRGTLARDGAGDPVGLVLADEPLGIFELRYAASLRSLAVVRSQQGSGLGLALVTSTLAAAAEQGAEVAAFRIDPTEERAVRLVRRLGFERNQDDALYGFGALENENWVLPS